MELNELDWGPEKLRSWARHLQAVIKANKPISGDGITVDDGPNGSPVNLDGDDGGDDGDGGGSSDGLGTHALDVCHMGAPAKRDFRCSDPYTE